MIARTLVFHERQVFVLHYFNLERLSSDCIQSKPFSRCNQSNNIIGRTFEIQFLIFVHFLHFDQFVQNLKVGQLISICFFSDEDCWAFLQLQLVQILRFRRRPTFWGNATGFIMEDDIILRGRLINFSIHSRPGLSYEHALHM